MFSIGIDSSSTNTAIVILKNGKLYDYFLISPKSKDILARSLSIIDDLIYNVSKYDVKKVKIGIEAASFQSVGMRDKLSMLLGGIYYGLRLLDYDVSLYPPSTIKKQYCGNGRAKKPEMLEATPKNIVNIFKAEYKKLDDLVDAYAIATIIHKETTHQ